MFPPPRKLLTVTIFALCFTIALYVLAIDRSRHPGKYSQPYRQRVDSPWTKLPQRHPVTSFQELPTGQPLPIPMIQHTFGKETTEARKVRRERLKKVRESFTHAWSGYKSNAWLKDEVAPLSGEFRDSFGGRAATLVDSLDTLWIMGFRVDFEQAVAAIEGIDFGSSTSKVISVFETTIRYLGGLLSAYDLSGNSILLKKAIELGEMLYVAFDTPNRMPVPYWDWRNAFDGGDQIALLHTVSADVGSLSLEFTRLSQLSGDPKYFDAIQRIADNFASQQNRTSLPGMWPVFVNSQYADFATGSEFSLGAMADSLYEYLPKQYMLLGGLVPQYLHMYESFMNAAKKTLFFRPMNPDNKDILISGGGRASGNEITRDSSGQHLTCFVRGMAGIGAKIFDRDDDLDAARKLTDGCIWAYESMPSGIMPEMIDTVPCLQSEDCLWDENKWHEAVLSKGNPHSVPVEQLITDKGLPPGFSHIQDGRYILRPEAIESVFIMYRITGDKTLQEKAWNMFQSIEKHTRTDIAHAALEDVSKPKPVQLDHMESFWTGETLKYFYLIFSEPNVISLDEYVFNTEAHPFRRASIEKKNWWRP